MPFRVLYDGWPLTYRPNGPAALHLLTLLAYRPPEVEAHVAIPAALPFQLESETTFHLELLADNERARLKWEQRVLPGLSRRLDTRLLHLTGANAALLNPTSTVISPTSQGMYPFSEQRPTHQPGLASRWREAAGAVGSLRAHAVLWPADLPEPPLSIPLMGLSPAVHPAFNSQSPNLQAGLAGLELPEPYILYHGPHTSQDLSALLAAWSWAAGPIGGDCPLLLLGLEDADRARLAALLSEYDLAGSVRALPALPVGALAAVYQGCAVLFNPVDTSPWGSSIRRALSCGKPVVALQTALTDALVGPAAYLVSGSRADPAGSRALGAALITVIVEESLSAALSQAAIQRAAAWSGAAFSQQLFAAYQKAALV
ncbi:MAG TPA: glycosyltransferase [Anaerolineales bacterium]